MGRRVGGGQEVGKGQHGKVEPGGGLPVGKPVLLLLLALQVPISRCGRQAFILFWAGGRLPYNTGISDTVHCAKSQTLPFACTPWALTH